MSIQPTYSATTITTNLLIIIYSPTVHTHPPPMGNIVRCWESCVAADSRRQTAECVGESNNLSSVCEWASGNVLEMKSVKWRAVSDFFNVGAYVASQQATIDEVG